MTCSSPAQPPGGMGFSGKGVRPGRRLRCVGQVPSLNMGALPPMLLLSVAAA